jgi:hypothetical protein
MTDPILRKAEEKRDQALRELERWEQWIKAYTELSDPRDDALDIPMTRDEQTRADARAEDVATPILAAGITSQTVGGKGHPWLISRSGAASA